MTVLITGGSGDIAQGIKKVLEENNKVLTPSKQELQVTDPLSIEKYLQTFPEIDLLINCAGYIKPDYIVDTAITDFVKHFEINVFGAVICSNYVIKNKGCKTIINIGSTSAFEGREKWGAYCSSKAALMSLTETLAREGYNSYAIHPAKTDTKMRNSIFPTEDTSLLMDPLRVGHFVKKIIEKEFSNGSHIIIKKDRYYVLPMREVFK